MVNLWRRAVLPSPKDIFMDLLMAILQGIFDMWGNMTLSSVLAGPHIGAELAVL